MNDLIPESSSKLFTISASQSVPENASIKAL